MKRGPRTFLSLECLEDRWVPATVRLINSYLLVSSQTAALTLTQTAHNQFSVQDGTTTTTYNGVANIYITGTNRPDTITVNLGAFTYSGSLLINSGNGADSVTITSSGSARALGDTTILTGLGNDTVNLNSTGGSSVRFGGQVRLYDPVGTNTVNFGNATGTTSVGGLFSIAGYSTVNIGTTTPLVTSTDVLGGGLAITDSFLNVPVNVNVTDGVTINKSLTVYTGNNVDLVKLGAITVNGPTTVNLGNNTAAAPPGGGLNPTDILQLGRFTGLAPQPLAVFNGDVNVTQGSGNGSFRISQFTDIAGNLNVSLGDGDNDFTVDSASGFTADGNVNVTAGNGDNNIGVDGTIAGNVTIRLGNSSPFPGGNFTSLTIAPAGLLTYTSGNGQDTLALIDLGPVQTWNVNAHFGSDDDTVVLIGVGILNGLVDADGSVTGNTFVQNGWLLEPNVIIANFP